MERCSCGSYYEKMLATGEVKCIDEEIPFEIPKGWEWCRMREIIYPPKYGTSSKSLQKGDVPVLRMGNIQDGKINYDKLVYSNNTEDNRKYRLLDGDLLFNRTNSAELVGKTAIFKGSKHVIYAGYLILLRPIIANSDYLNYVFLSPYVRSYCKEVKTIGVQQCNINADKVSQLLIPVAPLGEQIRIVGKIKEIQPSIDRYSASQNNLDLLNISIVECLKKSILQEAIQGKLVPQIAEEGTAQELLEKIQEEKQRLVNEGKLKKSALATSTIFRGDDNKYYELIDNSPVCIDEFLPFQIPETWTWCKVKDLLEIQTGASFKKEQANANKKGIRILRGGNILPNKYIFKDDDVFVSEEFVNANTILKKNCIITPAVTSLENIGKMAVIEKDYNNVSAGGFVFIISPYIQDFNHSLLLAYFLQSPFLIEAMQGITKKSGAAFYNLGKERLKELYLPLPPMTEQSRIVGKINEILSSIMSK